MKKICFYILLSVFFTFSVSFVTYANECPWNCRIKDNPSPWLERYFWDLDAILSNIRSQSRSQWVWQLQREIQSERNRVIWSLNRTLNFWEYYCSFDFFISLNITNETPSQVTRDSRRLEMYRDTINQLLENTERRWNGGITAENICSGVQNCPFSWNDSLRDILVKLSENNSLILQHFRASILEKQCAPELEIILVPWNFLSELQLYYNKDTLMACSSCEEEFTWRTLERIRNISFKNSDYRTGIQAWREAWAMLKWWFSSSWNPESREQERDEGISEWFQNFNIVNITHNNRDRYGAWWLSTTDSEDNQSAQAVTQTTPTIPSFQEAMRQEIWWRERIPITQIPTTQIEIERTQTIAQTIQEVYDSQLPYSLIQDTQSEEVLLRMIRMHIRLSESINLLERFVPRSERVCDRQGTGMWQCAYR